MIIRGISGRGLTKRGTLEWTLASVLKVSGKCFPGIQSSRCKGPGAEASLRYFRNLHQAEGRGRLQSGVEVRTPLYFPLMYLPVYLNPAVSLKLNLGMKACWWIVCYASFFYTDDIDVITPLSHCKNSESTCHLLFNFKKEENR